MYDFLQTLSFGIEFNQEMKNFTILFTIYRSLEMSYSTWYHTHSKVAISDLQKKSYVLYTKPCIFNFILILTFIQVLYSCVDKVKFFSMYSLFSEHRFKIP